MSTPGVHRDLRARSVAALANERVVRAVHLATLRKVDQRASGMAQLRNAESLRERAAQIKRHTLAHLRYYLHEFARRAAAAGATLHFASDGAAAARLIAEIAETSGCRRGVKAKSMTTEEVNLNAALEARGIEVLETDLGEFIVQLDGDRPSHIVTPVIHKDRAQIGSLLARRLGCERTDDPTKLSQIARAYLREAFRRCDLGITGVNFAIAQTGTICICTNEGNGRMTTSRPRVHIALMGIEKVIPRMADLAVFLKLLSRSSTGQPMTVYTTLITGPRRAGDADGPAELHIVLLDGGRAALLGTPAEPVLACIRCGACLNACPVYRNIGGHAYDSVYPGPIGALVTPLLSEARRSAAPGARELPRASSLCGACAAACPVRIDIPALLVELRRRYAQQTPLGKRIGLAAWARIAQREAWYRAAQWAARGWLGTTGFIERGAGPLVPWTRVRDLPAPAPESFRQWWARTYGDAAETP